MVGTGIHALRGESIYPCELCFWIQFTGFRLRVSFKYFNLDHTVQCYSHICINMRSTGSLIEAIRLAGKRWTRHSAIPISPVRRSGTRTKLEGAIQTSSVRQATSGYILSTRLGLVQGNKAAGTKRHP